MKQNRAQVYIVLLHYPTVNKKGDLVTTAITNYDIHDIARTCRTYCIEKYYIVNPMESQIMLCERILNYWAGESGVRRKADRKDALSLVEIKKNLEGVIIEIVKKNGMEPLLIATTAKDSTDRVSFSKLRTELNENKRPYLLIFGTGYGLHPQILERADCILEPIRGLDKFNHLSVRSAVAIILDRLLGDRMEDENNKFQNESHSVKQKEEKYASSY